MFQSAANSAENYLNTEVRRRYGTQPQQTPDWVTQLLKQLGIDVPPSWNTTAPDQNDREG
jgi:transposase-like protein